LSNPASFDPDGNRRLIRWQSEIVVENPYQAPKEMTPASTAGTSSNDGDLPKRLPVWKIFAPFVAFLAGPAIVIFFWVLVVYVFERSHYISFYERIDELIPALPVGFVIGLVGAVIVAVRVFFSD
jgi:hypothetical protein